MELIAWSFLVAWMFVRYMAADVVHAIKGTTPPRHRTRQAAIKAGRPTFGQAAATLAQAGAEALRRRAAGEYERRGVLGYLADLKDDTLAAATDRRRARRIAKEAGAADTTPTTPGGPATTSGPTGDTPLDPDGGPRATTEDDGQGDGHGDERERGFADAPCAWCGDTGELITTLIAHRTRMPCPFCLAGRRRAGQPDPGDTNTNTNTNTGPDPDAHNHADAPYTDEPPTTVRATAERIARPELTSSGTTTERNTSMSTLATTDADLDPRAALKFSQEMEQLATLLVQKLDAAQADLAAKKVTGAPLNCMTAMGEAASTLIRAAREAQTYFQQHVGVQDHVESVTHVGGDDYLRQNMPVR